jgi:hypothetical protein
VHADNQLQLGPNRLYDALDLAVRLLRNRLLLESGRGHDARHLPGLHADNQLFGCRRLYDGIDLALRLLRNGLLLVRRRAHGRRSMSTLHGDNQLQLASPGLHDGIQLALRFVRARLLVESGRVHDTRRLRGLYGAEPLHLAGRLHDGIQLAVHLLLSRLPAHRRFVRECRDGSSGEHRATLGHPRVAAERAFPVAAQSTAASASLSARGSTPQLRLSSFRARAPRPPPRGRRAIAGPLAPRACDHTLN